MNTQGHNPHTFAVDLEGTIVTRDANGSPFYNFADALAFAKARRINYRDAAVARRDIRVLKIEVLNV